VALHCKLSVHDLFLNSHKVFNTKLIYFKIFTKLKTNVHPTYSALVIFAIKPISPSSSSFFIQDRSSFLNIDRNKNHIHRVMWIQQRLNISARGITSPEGRSINSVIRLATEEIRRQRGRITSIKSSEPFQDGLQSWE